jgi:hypothetical protein
LGFSVFRGFVVDRMIDLQLNSLYL